MSEFGNEETILLALEPGLYTHAVGIAMGSAEILREDGSVGKFLTLMFLDCEGGQQPILLTLEGEVLKYLLSETFQRHLREQVAETT